MINKIDEPKTVSLFELDIKGFHQVTVLSVALESLKWRNSIPRACVFPTLDSLFTQNKVLSSIRPTHLDTCILLCFHLIK